MTSLKVDLVGLYRDVDEMKSIDLSMIFGTVDILDAPSLNIQACSNVPSATTIRDDIRVDHAKGESDAEKDDEQHAEMR